MRFARTLRLMAKPAWREHYVDYASLKRVFAFDPASDVPAESDESDDAAARGPRATAAAAAASAASYAAGPAGGPRSPGSPRPHPSSSPSSSDPSLHRAAFLAEVGAEVGKAAAFYELTLAAAGRAVEAAAAATDAAADGGECSCAGDDDDPHTAAALAAAQAAISEASSLLTDLKLFAQLNATAAAKAAKKFDRRQAPAVPTGPDVDALVSVSSIANGAPLAALEAACAEMGQRLPPPPSPSAARPRNPLLPTAAEGVPAAAGSSSSSCSSSAADVPFVHELDLSSLPPGSLTRLRVILGTDRLSQHLAVPVLVARGAHAGPVLGVTAAVHGNEVQGTAVIHRLLASLDPLHLAGTVLAVPVVNVAGYVRLQRGFSDGADLNRLFPGKKGGTAAQQFALHFFERVAAKCDVLLDLHTASFGRVNSLYVRADMRDERAARLALLQRPQIVVHSTGDGSLRSAFSGLGRPAVTVEIGDPLVIQQALVAAAHQGVLNTLQHLKMLPPQAQMPSPPPALLRPGSGGGDGDQMASGGGSGGGDSPARARPAQQPAVVVCARSFWIFASTGGLLQVEPGVASWVRKGSVLARIHDVFGGLEDVVVAPCDGVVVGRSSNPVCESGDRILHLGVVDGSFAARAEDGHL
jgi:predicted deacylase